jgi:hypothetical protein
MACPAVSNSGECLESGGEWLGKDLSGAVRWRSKAADLWYGPAMSHQGEGLETLRGWVREDLSRAIWCPS